MKVGVIVGSNRRESINRRLAEALVRLAGDRCEARFIRIDDLPLYNQDLEGNRPDEVDRFTAETGAMDALLFVSPEHNRSVTALLKNALDWGSKPPEANVWRDKPAAITGTSLGAIGTAVGQQHLRQILAVNGALVMGGEAYIAFKPDLIDGDGDITNAGTRDFLQAFVDRFLDLAEKLSS